MAGRMPGGPGVAGRRKRVHEAFTLVTLGLIAGHAGLLLFDGYLRPGLAGITLPFALAYRPAFTGLGIIGGWLAAILGLSYYVRNRIGTRTWRRMHRLTIIVYLLALAHVVGAGTNGRSWWMLALLDCTLGPDRVRLHLPRAPPDTCSARRSPTRRERRVARLGCRNTRTTPVMIAATIADTARLDLPSQPRDAAATRVRRFAQPPDADTGEIPSLKTVQPGLNRPGRARRSGAAGPSSTPTGDRGTGAVGVLAVQRGWVVSWLGR